MKKYFILLAFSTILCWALVELAVSQGIIDLPAVFRNTPLLFIALFNVGMHLILMSSAKGRPQLFVNYFIGRLSLKMFVHLIVMVAVAFMFPDKAVHFILLYAVYYLTFTAIETAYLFRYFTAKKQ